MVYFSNKKKKKKTWKKPSVFHISVHSAWLQWNLELFLFNYKFKKTQATPQQAHLNQENMATDETNLQDSACQESKIGHYKKNKQTFTKFIK